MTGALHPRSTEISFLLNNGTRMPAFGLGTANPPEKLAETKQAVKAAVKAGYRQIDTAWAYGTEPFVGAAIKELIEEGVIKREDLFITSKVWPVMWDEAERSLQQTLASLGVGYIDMWLQHWPLCYNKQKDEHGVCGLARNPEKPDGEPDYNLDADWIETYKQMEKIYLDPTDHRVKAIGVSNFPIEYIQRLFKECRVRPALNQVEAHPRLPQLEMMKFCHENGMLMTAYSPLGSHGAPNIKLPLVQELSKKYDSSPNDILTSYHIRQGNIVIPRSLNPTRISSNIQFVALSAEDISRLNDIGVQDPKRYVDEKWNVIVPGFTGAGPAL
ncbi:hypothetical protein HG535_0H03190 [Zygotorulaspora mrakii]|uniref:NADP-dependent oxidoreductase domain-containing protein n=1 Tax=Zygotorulaspora mrakii TaxID=42260 RepID=A0A7H9BB69_ZYGMR|nr:uncharacterized protein HG535_0H03190 [Zygotorulaspora mrakii]QLG74992.1 hypothetical protein HG535_0H03190 [Zygotorulaspora mrakii]